MRIARSIVAAARPKSPPVICLCDCATSADDAGPKRYCFGAGRGGCSPAGGGLVGIAGCAVPEAPGEPGGALGDSGKLGGGVRKEGHAVSSVTIAATTSVVRIKYRVPSLSSAAASPGNSVHDIP